MSVVSPRQAGVHPNQTAIAGSSVTRSRREGRRARYCCFSLLSLRSPDQHVGTSAVEPIAQGLDIRSAETTEIGPTRQSVVSPRQAGVHPKPTRGEIAE